MNLRALAVAMLACACARAGAQAQSLSQLYGSMDQGLEYIGAVPGSAAHLQVRAVWGSSRFGIREEEPLDGGWRLQSRLESRFSTSGTPSPAPLQLFNAQCWVGATGPSGTWRLGRDYTPLEDAMDQSDLTDQSFYFDNEITGLTPRASGMLSYRSPESLPLRTVLSYAVLSPSTGQRLAGGSISAGDDDLGAYVTAQRTNATAGSQSEFATGVRLQAGRVGTALTLAAIRVGAGAWRREAQADVRFELGDDSVVLAWRHEDGTGAIGDGGALIVLHRLSKVVVMYGAAAVAQRTPPVGARASLGLRQWF